MPFWPGLQRPKTYGPDEFVCPACAGRKPVRFMTAAPEGSKWRGQNICVSCSWGEQMELANKRLREEREKSESDRSSCY